MSAFLLKRNTLPVMRVPAKITASHPRANVPFLLAKNLGLRYEKRHALRDVSFSLQQGDSLGLLGPNGSGKSSLLRILAVLRKPHTGTLSLRGVDVLHDPRVLRQINGVVFQSSNADLKLSVQENLWIFGLLQGVARPVLRERIASFVARFALTNRQHDKVETLSGGLRRRVELMMAMLNKPTLLLLDEPTTGLDMQARTEFWYMVHTLRQEEGTSVVCAAHNLAEAATFQKVLMLHDGRRVAYDSPQGLKQKLGKKVVRIETKNPKALQMILQKNWAGRILVQAMAVLLLEVNNEDLASLLPMVEAHSTGIRIGEPLLEDVFFSEAGVAWS